MSVEMRKLQGNKNGTFMISLPQRFVKSLDLKKADMIRLDIHDENKIVMQKVNL